MVLPTEKQIENCALMSWEYIGDGIFERNGQMGWFTSNGFHKD